MKKWAFRTVFLGLLTCLGAMLSAHFFLTFLYLSPMNPLKVAFWDATYSHHADLFAQNWSLFAPTPVHHNIDVHIKCKTAGEQESDWYDMTKGLLDGLHRQPWGAYVRLVRVPLTTIRLWDQPLLVSDQEKFCKDGQNSDYCRSVERILQSSLEQHQRSVARLASSACPTITDGEPVQRVKVRIVYTGVRPYSERDNPAWKPEVAATETDWLPYQSVALFPYALPRKVTQP